MTVSILDGEFYIQKLLEDMHVMSANRLTSLQADRRSASAVIRGKDKHVHHRETVSLVER